MILQTYGKELVSLVVPFITWAINTYTKAKARLLVARPHAFTFLVQEPLHDAQGNVVAPNQTINTSSFNLSNGGRESATNVELVFNWKPYCINVWPPRHFEEKIGPDGRYTLGLGSLAPREDVSFEMFAINGDVPALLVARSQQCVATPIHMSPQPVAALWKVRTVAFLSFVGFATVVYGAILLVQFLVLRTPYGH